jgi:hypothetical protein
MKGLSVNIEDLAAALGQSGKPEVQVFLERHPDAGVLFRRMPFSKALAWWTLVSTYLAVDDWDSVEQAFIALEHFLQEPKVNAGSDGYFVVMVAAQGQQEQEAHHINLWRQSCSCSHNVPCWPMILLWLTKVRVTT